MAVLTNFLKLLKPEKNDYVDVDKHISENYDKIDSKMQELSTSNSGKLDKGAVSTEYDTAKKIEDKIKAVQSTADNKLNKGSLPATVPDGKAIYDLLENNGGLNIDTALLYLNDAGTKTAGKVYFDKNKKGLFECRQTTTTTINSTDYFVDISNKASADRLTNLFRNPKKKITKLITFDSKGISIDLGITNMDNINFIIFYTPQEDGQPRIPNTLIVPSMYNKELNTISTGAGFSPHNSNFAIIFYKIYNGKLTLRTCDLNSAGATAICDNIGLNIEIY